MKTMKITVGEMNIELRLTAAKLAEYATDTGSRGATLYAVMDALDYVEARAKLLTAALTFKGNNNPVLDGFELVDMLADAGWDPVEVKEMIVSLGVDAGVIGRDDAAKMKLAIRTGAERLCRAAVAVLSGNPQEAVAAANAAENGSEELSENPT